MAETVLEVFSDYVCPWCYLGRARAERLRREYAVQLKFTPFPLHPDAPDEGIPLSVLFRGRSLEPAHARLRSLFDAEGLPHNIPNVLYNSRLAQELGKWGEERGKPELHDALFRANFVDGKNLADLEALVLAAESVGLAAAEARAVVSERRFKHAVEQDWVRARALGVSGVPTFVIGDAGFSGAQPYEVLERFAVEMGATRR